VGADRTGRCRAGLLLAAIIAADVVDFGNGVN
jgi:hypothetical protein